MNAYNSLSAFLYNLTPVIYILTLVMAFWLGCIFSTYRLRKEFSIFLKKMTISDIIKHVRIK